MHIETRTLPQHLDLAEQVAQLAQNAAAHDGIDPLSEQFLLGLRDARLGHEHLLAVDGERIVGVAARDGDQVELVVSPDHRRAGVGQALYDALPAHPHLWAHGNLPAAQALAKKNGMDVVRRLLVMAIKDEKLRDAAGQPSLDEGLDILSYTESVGRFDRARVEEEWVRVNNEAFSWHPEQGGWDIARLQRGMEAEWFDPADVLLLWDGMGGSDDSAVPDQTGATLAGFHWLKWHTEEDPAFGEVYVVGLSEAFRGRRLGGPLLSAGLKRMVNKGAEKVVLYVEADNEPAVKAYERLGFSIAEEHCVWAESD